MDTLFINVLKVLVWKSFRASVNDYYSILQKIGEGKFSVVYLCEDKKTKQVLAIKIIEKFKLSK